MKKQNTNPRYYNKKVEKKPPKTFVEKKPPKTFIEDIKLSTISKSNMLKEDIHLLELKMRVTKGDAHVYAFINKKDGVSHRDCIMATKIIQASIKSEGFDDEYYSITVSSAGINRTFKSDDEYEIFLGSDIKIKFFTDDDNNNSKDDKNTETFNAKLIETDGSSILIEIEDDKKIRVLKKNIIRTRLNN